MPKILEKIKSLFRCKKKKESKQEQEKAKTEEKP